MFYSVGIVKRNDLSPFFSSLLSLSLTIINKRDAYT